MNKKRAEREIPDWTSEHQHRIRNAIQRALSPGVTYDPDRVLFLSIAIGHAVGRKGMTKLKAIRLTREFLAGSP